MLQIATMPDFLIIYTLLGVYTETGQSNSLTYLTSKSSIVVLQKKKEFYINISKAQFLNLSTIEVITVFRQAKD